MFREHPNWISTKDVSFNVDARSHKVPQIEFIDEVRQKAAPLVRAVSENVSRLFMSRCSAKFKCLWWRSFSALAVIDMSCRPRENHEVLEQKHGI